MAGRTMDVSVLVRLVDRLTGPLRAIQSRIAGLAALGQRIGILGAAVAAISFMAPINSAAAFDQKLRDIAVTSGLSGDAAEARIRSLTATYQDLALRVGIASSELVSAAGLLIASGMDDTLTNRLMPTIGRVSKAASAVPDDVAKVAFALTNSLGISADQMELAFAKLITAGKLGRFEFRDMARELPELASQFTKFKIAGMDAVETLGASLQVAMFGTDDTRAAANNFKNFLSKVLAPDAVKNFKEMGVDILGVMQSAAAQGINPIEAAVQKVLSLTGVSQKDALAIFNQKKSQGLTDAQAMAQALEQIKSIAGAGKLSQIFGDMQVLDFLLPMLANIDKYQQFKKEIENAGLDVIARDFATQWEGLQTQLTIGGEIGEQAIRRIGLAFGSNLRWINAWGIAALQWVTRIDERWPGMIDLVLSWGGAFLAAIAGLALLVPIITVFSAAFGMVGASLSLIAGAAGLSVRGVALLARALGLIGGASASGLSRTIDGFGRLDRKIDGTRRAADAASRRMIAGMSSAASQGSVSGFSTFGQRAGNAVSIAFRGALWIAGSLTLLMEILDDLNRTAEERLEASRKSGEAYRDFEKGLDQTWAGKKWKEIQDFFRGTATPADVPVPLTNVPLPLPRPDALKRLDDTARDAAARVTAPFDKININPAATIAPAMDAELPKIEDAASGIMDRIRSIFGGGVSIPIKPLLPPAWNGGAGNDNRPAPAGSVAPAPQPGGRRLGSAEVGGTIVVSAAPGSRVDSVQSTNPAVPLKKADNGRMIGRV